MIGRTLLIVTTVLIWLGVIFLVGPRIEIAIAPPARLALTEVTRSGNQLSFFIEGEKLRNCTLESFIGSWVYASRLAEPVPIVRPEGSLEAAPPTLFQQGDHIVRGPFTVDIPPVDNVEFRVTYTYRCWPLWPVQIVLSAPLPPLP